MSLNQIQLTNQLLSHLYPDVLIETDMPGTAPLPRVGEPSASPQKQAPTTSVKFLGNNAKHIALLVNYSTVPFVPDGDLSFLTNILSACKLSLADVALLNIHSMEEGSMENVLETMEARSIILFGIPPLAIGLPINFPQFQLQAFNNRTYLYSPSLKELEAEKALKLKLWNNLKTLFGL